MSSQAEIFDRIEILKAIESEWLGGSGGSGVLLCTQKIGKSHLLDHIFSRHSENQERIVFQINMDYLRASLRRGEKLSDEVFLSFFLRRLRAKLQASIAQRDDWQQKREETQRRLEELSASNNPEAIALRAVLEPDLRFSQRRLDEIRTLEGLVQNINELLKQSEIVIPEVAEVLYDLASIGKRVMLIIDDYHQMVRDRSFSKALFHFLRGANQQKHVITLVSSQLQLMDDSLHGGDSERSQLFNHFNTCLLGPFINEEAESFLEWPSPSIPPLTPEERNYLRELGGGSPYFLKLAREEFLRKARPSNQEQRRLFESELTSIFEGAFRDIWLRCSPTGRVTLRRLAGGEAAEANNPLIERLEKEGYIRGGKAFSPLFFEFVKKQVQDDPNPEPEASAVIAYRIFPTALAYASPGEALVTFVLKNPTTERGRMQLDCELEPYSQKTPKL